MFDLEKLKNIDLQNIDLSKIDVNKIIETVLSKKDLFVSVIIGVSTVLIAIALTKNFFTQTATLNSETTLLKKKIEVIANYRSSQSKIKKYLSSIPKPLDEDLISSTITDIAASSNMTILSLIPGQIHDEDLYTYINGGIDVETPNYAALLTFLKNIESAPFALRIDNCSVLRIAGDRKNTKNQSITVHLDLTSVQIKK